MTEEGSKSHYIAPEVIEYGSIEAITEDGKTGDGEDTYNAQQSLLGSGVPPYGD